MHNANDRLHSLTAVHYSEEIVAFGRTLAHTYYFYGEPYGIKLEGPLI